MEIDDSALPGSEQPSNVVGIDYTAEFRKSYVTYAMSVIVARALPDVRDGLKPVHRRIIYQMFEGDFHSNKKHNKSARIVGDVMGKLHPHGDAAIYDAMVRLGQPWKLRVPLIDGQGNFGSMDGDPPAASRYTEARMAGLAHELTHDINKNTVPFVPNYDGSQREPTVLPARYPNLLVNGNAGIAVGMATNIATHNLGEVIDATLLLMDRPDATLEEVMEIIPGPDFPTKGVIMGRTGIRNAYDTGRGSIIISGVAEIEEGKRGRSQIVISELPYDVVKEEFVAKIADLVNGKQIEGISDLRDESDRNDAVRVVIDVKADGDPTLILNGLRKLTDFQKSFGYNATCLASSGKPMEMGIIQMLTEFVAFRRECVRKRTIFELDKTRDSQMKQIALYAATVDIDEVVRIVRTSPDVDTARRRLMERAFDADEDLMGLIREADPDADVQPTFYLNEVQANAILELSLRRLTGLERERIAEDLKGLAGEIRGYLHILHDPARLDEIIREELASIKAKYATPRLTRIETTEADQIDDEALVERKDVVVTLTRTGYVKRTDLGAFRAQKRGGKGKAGMDTKDDDFVISTIACTTKTPLLVFTDKGQAYSLKGYRLPEAAPNARGKYIGNLIELRPGERVTALVPLPEERDEIESMGLIFITSFGTVRRNSAKDFLDIKRNGKIAMKLDGEGGSEGGSLVAVLVASETDNVLVATANGMAIRFPVDECRIMSSRESVGVRAINLKDRDRVVDATILVGSSAETIERDVYLAGGTLFLREKDLLNAEGVRRPTPSTVTIVPAPEEGKEDRLKVTLSAIRMEELRQEERFLLTVTENGFGKRSSTHEYRVTARGLNGITGAEITKATGPLVACLLANDDDGLMLITDGGQTIRTRTSDVSVIGRTSRGVRLLSLPEGQKLVSVARVNGEDMPEDEDDTADGAAVGTPDSN